MKDKHIVIVCLLLLVLILLTASALSMSAAADEITFEPIPSISPTTTPVGEIDISVPTNKPLPELVEPEDVFIIPETDLTDEEVELIALLTMTEAEGEPEEGQRLVIDTVLNMVDNPRYPNNVHDVVFRKNTYDGMHGTRYENCVARFDSLKDKLCDLVESEALCRSSHEVMFFRTKHYHDFGVPMCHVGNHYFSKEE